METSKALFSLIRSGLQIEHAYLEGKINWEKLYEVASEQGVIAIVSEGISQEFDNGSPAESLITDLRLQFIGELVSAEQTYQSLWKSLS